LRQPRNQRGGLPRGCLRYAYATPALYACAPVPLCARALRRAALAHRNMNVQMDEQMVPMVPDTCWLRAGAGIHLTGAHARGEVSLGDVPD